jgi:hypothetical protein
MSQLSHQVSQIHSQPLRMFPVVNNDHHWEHYASKRPLETAYRNHLIQPSLSSACMSIEPINGFEEPADDSLMALLTSKDVVKLITHLNNVQIQSNPHDVSAGTRLKACCDAVLEAHDQLILEMKTLTAISFRSTLRQHTPNQKRHRSFYEQGEEQMAPLIQYGAKPIRTDQNAELATAVWEGYVPVSVEASISGGSNTKALSKRAVAPTTTPTTRQTMVYQAKVDSQLLSSAVEKAAKKLACEEMQLQQKLQPVTSGKSKGPYGGMPPMFEPCPDQDLLNKREGGMSSMVKRVVRKVVCEDMRQQKLTYMTAGEAQRHVLVDGKRTSEDKRPMFEPCPDQKFADEAEKKELRANDRNTFTSGSKPCYNTKPDMRKDRFQALEGNREAYERDE